MLKLEIFTPKLDFPVFRTFSNCPPGRAVILKARGVAEFCLWV
jgi:hypothetical protein